MSDSKNDHETISRPPRPEDDNAITLTAAVRMTHLLQTSSSSRLQAAMFLPDDGNSIMSVEPATQRQAGQLEGASRRERLVSLLEMALSITSDDDDDDDDIMSHFSPSSPRNGQERTPGFGQ
jgi:hypothetical protein